METLSGWPLYLPDHGPHQLCSSSFIHLFAQHTLTDVHMCHIRPKSRETHCVSASGSRQFDRAGAQPHTAARDTPRTGGAALLEVLTEPWLGDDSAGPAAGKLPAWRGCRVKAFLIPLARWTWKPGPDRLEGTERPLVQLVAAIPVFPLHLLQRRWRPREGQARCNVTEPFPPRALEALVRKSSGTHRLISEGKCRFQWCLTHLFSTCSGV